MMATAQTKGNGLRRVKNPEDRLPVGKFLAWRAGAFSVAANMMIMGYLTIYCTDTLKLDPILVGTVLMVSKIIDAVGEVLVGLVIDRAHFKMGKGRPWDLCVIGLWVFTVLLFSAPAGASGVVKIGWVAVCYFFVQSVFQTLMQAGSTPYTLRAFRNKTVIVKVQSYGGLLGMVLSIGISSIFPGLMAGIADSPSGWTKLMLIFAVPLTVIGLLRFLFVKEIYPVEGDLHEKITLKHVLQAMTGNRYIWFVAGISMLVQLFSGMNAGVYYFTYIVGDVSRLGMISMLSIVLMPLMMVFPKIIKGFSVSGLIGVGAMIAIGGNILLFFAGTNMTLMIIGSILNAVGMLAPPYLVPIMIFDTAKYNLWRGRPAMDATMASVNNFGGQLGSGIGSALMGLILGLGGYIGGAEVQTDGALMSIRLLYSLIPAAMYGILFILARLFTKLEKQLPQIEKDLAERSAEGAQGEANEETKRRNQ